MEVKKKYNDRIICDVCRGSYTRSNRSTHNKSQKHRIYNNMVNKYKAIMFPECMTVQDLKIISAHRNIIKDTI